MSGAFPPSTWKTPAAHCRHQRSYRSLFQSEGAFPSATRSNTATPTTEYRKRFTGGKLISNEELLALDVDVLAPCALENQIRQANAADVKAQLIVEGANGPTTAGADKILQEKGIIVVPDILANGGGVTVSYMEWTQNRFGYYYAEDEINKRADRSMSRIRERLGCR